MVQAQDVNATGVDLDYPELQEFAQSLLAEEAGIDLGEASFTGESASVAPAVTLELGDLLTDEAGELVLSADTAIELHAEMAVVEQGVADVHTTAAGDDVSGYAFVMFDGGPTLYYPPELDLAVTSGDIAI